MDKKYIYAMVFLGLAVAAFFILTNQPGKYDKFAQCMDEKGVKMYGAFWCPHCKAQKEAFGSSFKYINYVECSTPDGKGRTQQCSSAGIESYPTWEFSDGSRSSGLLSFEDLSRKSGCPLELQEN